MNWRPISEYRTDMGPVLVWLWWPQYDRTQQALSTSGDWMVAHQVIAKDAPVWVTAHDCIPCETTGREISHFMQMVKP